MVDGRGEGWRWRGAESGGKGRGCDWGAGGGRFRRPVVAQGEGVWWEGLVGGHARGGRGGASWKRFVQVVVGEFWRGPAPLAGISWWRRSASEAFRGRADLSRGGAHSRHDIGGEGRGEGGEAGMRDTK